MKKASKLLALLLVLIVAASALVACTDNEPTQHAEPITITVDVVNKAGETTTYTIVTKEINLRKAMEQEIDLKGEESTYGLYLKEVNGERADYNLDGAYWRLFKGDQDLMTGLDKTKTADGDYYRIVYTKE